MQTFNDFCQWARDVAYKCHSLGIIADFEIGQICDNQSARLEIETRVFLAEIVFWQSCDYFSEIIDIKIGQTIYRISNKFLLGQEFGKAFAAFLKKIEMDYL